MTIPFRTHTPLVSSVFSVLAGLFAAATAVADDGPAKEPSRSIVAPAPTRSNPEATVAEPAGSIAVGSAVADDDLRETLLALLSRYPGVRAVEVAVDHGVVTLCGHVEDRGVRDHVRDLARRVEGVRLVINDIKTDAQVLGATEFAAARLRKWEWRLAGGWSQALMACGTILGSFASARLFGRHAGSWLAPFVVEAHRSLVVSAVGLAIVGGGVLIALSLLGLTESALSVLGLAGALGGAKKHLTGRDKPALHTPKRRRGQLGGRFRRFRRFRIDAPHGLASLDGIGMTARS